MTEPLPHAADAEAVDDLSAVLDATDEVLRNVAADQAHLPTPCPELDVEALVDHVLTWSRNYAARLAGTRGATQDGVPDDPSTVLRSCSVDILAAYRSGTQGAQELPIDVVLMDYLGHTWDLAVATGQSVRFPDSAVVRALAAGEAMLTQENRGDSFGPPLPSPPDATSLERFVAFLGRDPRWTARRRTPA